MQKGHFVYKYVNSKGEIIYIGKCDTDLCSRISTHGKKGDNIPAEYWNEIKSCDVFYITLVNSIMSDVIESELIRKYKPKCNSDNDYKKKTNWQGMEFNEPKWKKYNPPVQKQKKEIDKASFEERCERQLLRFKELYQHVPCEFIDLDMTALYGLCEDRVIKVQESFFELSSKDSTGRKDIKIDKNLYKEFINKWISLSQGKGSGEKIHFTIRRDAATSLFNIKVEYKRAGIQSSDSEYHLVCEMTEDAEKATTHLEVRSMASVLEWMKKRRLKIRQNKQEKEKPYLRVRASFLERLKLRLRRAAPYLLQGVPLGREEGKSNPIHQNRDSRSPKIISTTRKEKLWVGS